MQDKQPWIVARQTTDEGELTVDAQNLIDNCLHICLQLCANLAIFINPFLPFTAKKMCHMMKVIDRMLDWENDGKLNLLKTGYMSSKYLVSCLMFLLKYFFDIEREITQQMITTMNLRFNDCKEIVHNLYQVAIHTK